MGAGDGDDGAAGRFARGDPCGGVLDDDAALGRDPQSRCRQLVGVGVGLGVQDVNVRRDRPLWAASWS
jgi:hypothetical protein